MAVNVFASPSSSEALIVGVPFFEGATQAATEHVAPDESTRKRRGFEGKSGQATAFDVDDITVLALGLGKANEVTLDTLRRTAATFVRAASGVEHAAIALTSIEVAGADAKAKAQAVTEGVLLGSYRFGEYKSADDDRKLSEVVLLDADTSGVERGQIIAQAVCLARDLINRPPAAMTPTHFADVATEVANENGLSITVWDENRIESEGLGGLRGVSLGSSQPPRFVELAHEPLDRTGKDATATISLVGKGITFDSGGLSLKPTEGMLKMKSDMAGAAAVLAAMSAIARLAPQVRVLAFMPLTENMPGPEATKISDVLRARNGKTIEVLNTDAEGRLVLADALSIAVEREPDAIVDIATLTGAVMVALGEDVAGLMGNNDALIEQVKGAANNTDESVWQLPLPAKYRKHLDSSVADLKNVGPRFGSSITAGIFLKEFVGEVPWAHLDIAGTAFVDSDDAYITRGGTGFGVRMLVDLVENFTKP